MQEQIVFFSNNTRQARHKKYASVSFANKLRSIDGCQKAVLNERGPGVLLYRMGLLGDVISGYVCRYNITF